MSMMANLGAYYGAVSGISATQQMQQLLFGAGQQGILFYPKPIVDENQILFQNNAGTVIASANGASVGLGLEWSQGLELGSNIVPSDYTTTSWEQNFIRYSIDQQVDKIVATCTQTYTFGAWPGLNLTGGETITLSAGAWYLYEFTITTIEPAGQPPGFYLYVEGDIAQEPGKTYSDGVHQAIFRSNIDQTVRAGVGFNSAELGFSVEVSGFSLRALPGSHLATGVSADRPMYGTDGSLHWLAHDGVGDNLQTVYTSALPQPCTLSVAIDKQDAGTDTVIITGLGSADRHQISINSSGNLVAIAGGVTLDSGAGLSNGKHIVTVVLDGAGSSIRVDGTEVATGDLGTATAGGITLSSLWDGTLPIQQDVYGAIHAEGVGNLSAIESYLSDLVGITL